MSRSSFLPTAALSATALCSGAALAFTAAQSGPRAGQGGHEHGLRGAADVGAAATAATSSLPLACGVPAVVAAGLLVNAASRRQRSRVATAAVVKKDAAGRFRFVTPVVVLEPSEQPGVTAPFGFFDPLGFSKKPLMVFPEDPNGFRHLREAEIKHGRVAMMAALGSVVAHFVKMPGFEEVPTGLAALSTPKGSDGFGVLFCLAGLFEATNWKRDVVPNEPGSYGNPFKIDQFTPEMRSKELNNGRIAMFAIMGQIAAEMQTGLDPVQQFNAA